MTQSPYTAAEAMREAAAKAVSDLPVSMLQTSAFREWAVRAIRALPLPAAPSEPTAEGQDDWRTIADERLSAYLQCSKQLIEAQDDLARMKAAMEKCREATFAEAVRAATLAFIDKIPRPLSSTERELVEHLSANVIAAINDARRQA